MECPRNAWHLEWDILLTVCGRLFMVLDFSDANRVPQL